MSRPRTEIEVTVQDRASRALRLIRERFASLNNGRVGRAMAQVSRATGQAAATLKHYAAAGAVLTAGTAFMVKGVAETAAEFERYRTVLETIEGSSAKAKESMNWVSEFAAKTPYELDEVNEAFVKLKSYGLDPIKDGLLTTLGDTSAGMGKPLMQTVEAIADAMTGQNERLKEFGIKAAAQGNKIIYEYTDKSGKQMRAMANKNNREQIRATLQTIWNEKYGGAMDKLSNTWGGMMSNLSDNWERFKLMIADSGVFGYLQDKLRGLLEKIDAMAQDGSLQKLAETIGQNLVKVFEKAWEFGTKLYDKFNEINDYLGGFGNTMLVVAAILSLPLVAAFVNVAWAVGSLAVALVGALPAVWSFTAALLANPITWVIGLVIALAGAVYLIYRNWDSISAYFHGLWDGVSDAFSSALAWIKSACVQAFDTLSGLFLNFTPVGWMIRGMVALFGYLREIWQKIKETFSSALDAAGSLLSGFSPAGLMAAGFEILQGYVSAAWDWIAARFQAALDFIGGVLSAFSPVNFVLAAYEGLKSYIGGVWDWLRTRFQTALSALGGVLSGFSPLNLMRAGFESLKSYISGVWDWIQGRLQWVLDKIESVGNAARQAFGGGSAPAPNRAAAALPGTAQGFGKVAVQIDHRNAPRGTRMQATASNNVNLSTRQGYSLAT